MSIKTFKPTTPSRRHMTVSGFDGIDKHAKPEASLTEVLKKNAGRNSYGHITVRHRGGGEKRKYRIIDFKRDKVDMEATVLRLEYDPNRSANIALVQYEDGEKRYIIAPVGLTAGDKVLSSASFRYKLQYCNNDFYPLYHCHFTFLHSVLCELLFISSLHCYYALSYFAVFVHHILSCLLSLGILSIIMSSSFSTL